MRRFIIPMIALVAGASVANTETNGVFLDPARIGWSSVEYRASLLFISIDTAVSIEVADPVNLPGILIEPGEGKGAEPGDAVTRVRLMSNGLGLHSEISLFLNTDTGLALQRVSHDTGKRMRHRIYRFTDIGAYQRTWWPVGDAEKSLPRDRWPEWSERAEGLYPYPEEAFNAIVTEPGGLLYLVGAAPLNKVGDEFEILAYIRRHVHRVRIEVVGIEDIREKFDEYQGGTRIKRKGTIPTLKLLIRGEVLGDEDEDFEMLGLRGDISMNMDLITRAPLRVTGAVKIVGQITMRIQRLDRVETK